MDNVLITREALYADGVSLAAQRGALGHPLGAIGAVRAGVDAALATLGQLPEAEAHDLGWAKGHTQGYSEGYADAMSVVTRLADDRAAALYSDQLVKGGTLAEQVAVREQAEALKRFAASLRGLL